MRLLTSSSSEIDPFEAIKDHSRRQGPNAWIMLNMVSSVDGATAVDGLSSSLGGSGDREMFAAVRDICDVIIVGSATMAAEHYRPAQPNDTRQQRRIAAGGLPGPIVAIVSSSLDLDYSRDIFSDPNQRPIILTGSASPADKKRTAAKYAEVVEAGERIVDPKAMVAALAEMGHRVQLLEGGPKLNGHFINAGLLDEMFLTVSPKLVGGPSQRITVGAEPTSIDMRLLSILQHSNELYLRYLRS